jgi:hypothetical protein
LSTGPSNFVAGLGRSPSDVRRLLSRSLSDAACLLSSPLAGAQGCVFNGLSGLVLRAWIGHLCSPSFLIDEFANTYASASNAVAMGPFLRLLIFFGYSRRVFRGFQKVVIPQWLLQHANQSLHLIEQSPVSSPVAI